MEPLTPGTRVGPHCIQELLSWHTRGGVYRVSDQGQSRILKELLLPEGLTEEQRCLRIQNLERAVHSWQKLQNPQAIEILEFMPQGKRIYLLMPEQQGSTLKAQVRLRSEPPEPARSAQWADQLAQLVEQLLNVQHPLAFQLLADDRLLIDPEGRLTVFNPGWSELLWNNPLEAQPAPLQEGLQRFGKLLENLASGDRQHPPDGQNLPAGLLWTVSRCLQPEQGRAYHSFAEVRQTLRNLKVLGDEARNQRQLGALPPLVNFSLPSLAQLPRISRGLRWTLLLLTLTALLALGWLLRRLLAPGPSRPGLVVALGRDLYLHRPQLPLEHLWRFPAAVVSLDAHPDGSRLYVVLEGRSEVRLLDPDLLEERTLPLASPPLALSCSEGGRELQVYLQNQHLLRMDVSKDQERPLDTIKVAPDISAWCYRELPRTERSRRGHRHHEGLLTLHPVKGLTAYDATSGRKLLTAPHSGYSALLPTPQGAVLLMANSGQWVFLDPSFQPRQQGKLTLPHGRIQLRVAASQDHFWSLQLDTERETRVGWWQTNELRLLKTLAVDSSPTAVTTDEKGDLWWADSQRRLFRAGQQPLQIEQVDRLPHRATALVYLSADLRPKGLQKMMEEPSSPPAPR